MKKANIVVIDSLERSGTTLLSSIIHSQSISSCYRGVFHEFLSCNIGKWKQDYANASLIDYGNVQFVKNSNNGINNMYKMQYDILVQTSMRNLIRKEQYSFFTEEEWRILLNQTINSFKDLDNLYQELANLSKKEILAFRWNQGLAYINNFLRNDNHYWISLIRHPLDRALSDFKTFNVSFLDSLQFSRAYGENLEKTKKLKNHKIIYYEDLILKPSETIYEIYSFLGIKINNINFNLIQQSGKAYRVETSDLVACGKKHTEGVKYKGFESSKIGKYKQEVSLDYIEKFNSMMAEYNIYSRYIK